MRENIYPKRWTWLYRPPTWEISIPVLLLLLFTQFQHTILHQKDIHQTKESLIQVLVWKVEDVYLSLQPEKKKCTGSSASWKTSVFASLYTSGERGRSTSSVHTITKQLLRHLEGNVKLSVPWQYPVKIYWN